MSSVVSLHPFRLRYIYAKQRLHMDCRECTYPIHPDNFATVLLNVVNQVIAQWGHDVRHIIMDYCLESASDTNPSMFIARLKVQIEGLQKVTLQWHEHDRYEGPL